MVASGARLTLSDDSHGVGDVGFWYDNLPHFLSDNNVSELYYLERELVTSDSKEQGTRVLCKRLADWPKHSFWEKCAGVLKEDLW